MSIDHARFAVSRLNVIIGNYAQHVEAERATASPAVMQQYNNNLSMMRRFQIDIINHANNNSPILQAVSSLNSNNNNNNNN